MMETLVSIAIGFAVIAVCFLATPFLGWALERYFRTYCSWAEAKIKTWR